MKKETRETLDKMTFSQKASMLTGKDSKTAEFAELDIPPVNMFDGPSGIRKGRYIMKDGGVAVPTGSALGASWNKELLFEVGALLGDECLNEEVDMLLAPGVNMKRTPKCGRNFEYYSEDPLLSGILGAAFVNGLASKGIAASVKHYALNNQENDRVFINAEVDERTMREYYLKVFEIVLKNSSPYCTMNSYNKVGGIFTSENKYLLTDILRDEFGFDGMVVSDWGAVHDIALSIRAGLDLEMPYNPNLEEQLRDGIEKGKATVEDLDRAAGNVIEFARKCKKQKSGEKPGYIRDKQHERVQRIAEECMVLLRNNDDILPINGKKYKKIAVYGKHAEKPIISGAGSSKMVVGDKFLDSPIEYMKKYATEEGIDITYEAVNDEEYLGAEIVGKINGMQKNEMDLIVVFAGDNYGADTETEHWDRDNLGLPNYTNGLISSACDACDNVVVVLNTGSMIIPGRWHAQVKGAVQMWYPGEGGGKAIASVLFGKTNPSGKLSESFALRERADLDSFGDGYKTWYSEGPFVGYRYYDKNSSDIWFPFGHGLSYTKFEYSDLKLEKNYSEKEDDEIKISFKIKNTGSMPGKETAQLYIGYKKSVVLRPEKELKGFEKLYLEPGEEKTVELTISHDDLKYYNICLKKWHLESGTYSILVGASCSDIRLCAEYTVKNPNDYTIGKRKSELNMA